MKSILIIFLAVFAITFSGAQTIPVSDVPDEVKTAFKVLFPEAREVSWSNEKQGVFEAEFEIKDVDFSANFNRDGRWMETEKEISKKEIPVLVLNSLKSGFKGYRIREVEEITTPEGISYEFTISRFFHKKEISIAANGKLIND